MTIAVLLVPTNLEVRTEAFNRFIERHSVFGEFIVLKVVLEIRWSKPVPIDHGLFYRGAKLSGIRCRPNDWPSPAGREADRQVHGRVRWRSFTGF